MTPAALESLLGGGLQKGCEAVGVPRRSAGSTNNTGSAKETSPAASSPRPASSSNPAEARAAERLRDPDLAVLDTLSPEARNTLLREVERLGLDSVNVNDICSDGTISPGCRTRAVTSTASSPRPAAASSSNAAKARNEAELRDPDLGLSPEAIFRLMGEMARLRLDSVKVDDICSDGTISPGCRTRAVRNGGTVHSFTGRVAAGVALFALLLLLL